MALQIRYGTDTQFESGKENIASGEMGVTTDTERMVVGVDGGEFMEVLNIESLAPAYDTSYTYSTGDVVSRGGKLYELVGGSATGAWNSSLWSETSLGEIMEKIKLGKHTATLTGDIVTFDSDFNRELPFKKVSASIVAQQDLHGYDHPWVGGAGKNLIPYPYQDGSSVTINDVTFTVSSGGVVTVNGTASANAEFTLVNDGKLPAGTYTLSGLPSGGGSSTFVFNAYAFDENHTALFDFRTGVPRTETVESDIDQLVIRIRIISGYTANNLVIKPQFEKGSTATDYAPYSNICPISGWTGCEVNVTGTNVWDEEWENGTLNWSTGANATNNNRIRSKNYIPIKPNTDYYVKVPTIDGVSQNVYIFWYGVNKEFLSYISSSKGNVVVTSSNDAYYCRFFTASNTYGTTYNNDISINYPSTDTSYHAYNGNAYPVSWQTEAGTVYGGTIDVTTGVLTVTHQYATIDNNWTGAINRNSTNATNTFFDIKVTGSKTVGNTDTETRVMCDEFEPTYGGFITSSQTSADRGWKIALISSNRLLVSMATSYGVTTSNNFRLWLSSNPIHIVYELDTPQVVQLTAQQVKMLVGENNVWSDVDEVEVIYYTKESSNENFIE